MALMRWRLNDPAEEAAQRWTKVHVIPTAQPSGTSRVWALCGLEVPEHPYMDDVDDQIPEGAPLCQRCAKKVPTIAA